jgi:hypothetical protein
MAKEDSEFAVEALKHPEVTREHGRFVATCG